MSRMLVVLAALLLSACNNIGTLNGIVQTNTTLTSNNYRVVMTGVKGGDAGFRVFGIGGSAQISTAMEKIRAQAQLEERPRALINVTVDDSYWTVGIVGGSSLTVTADVIEFTGPPNGN